MFNFLSLILFLCIGTNIFAFEEINKEHTLSDESSFLSTPNKVLEESVCSEYANLDTVFERVIGLGNVCMTKSQINSYFNPDGLWSVTKQSKADLFDWMVINDYNLFSNALFEKLEDFFQLEDFVLLNNTNQGIFNTKYKIGWNHLYDKPSYNDGLIVNGLFVIEKFHSDFENIKTKISYLKEKFINAKSKKTIYIASSFCGDLELLKKLRDSILYIRDGNKDFVLLFIPVQKKFDSFENIIVYEGMHFPSNWWTLPLETARWHEIFDKFKFTSDIWN